MKMMTIFGLLMLGTSTLLSAGQFQVVNETQRPITLRPIHPKSGCLPDLATATVASGESESVVVRSEQCAGQDTVARWRVVRENQEMSTLQYHRGPDAGASDLQATVSDGFKVSVDQAGSRVIYRLVPEATKAIQIQGGWCKILGSC